MIFCSVKPLRMGHCLLIVLVLGLLGCAQTLKFKHAKVNFVQSDIELLVEFADNKKLRQQGLMHRDALCQNCGMLFQYDNDRIASMWMKNTFIPLDIAFVRRDGVIIEIKQLQPQDLTSIKSSKTVLYALEMNQGWFKANDVKVGDKLVIAEHP